MVFRLLSGVEDDPEIRQGLYPGTGANASTTGGGGKAKTEFYWKLAVQLFADHPSLSEPFSAVRGTSVKKLQAPWVQKVKNQLNRFTVQIRPLLTFLLTKSHPQAWPKKSGSMERHWERLDKG